MFRMGQWKCDREVKFDFREEREGSTMKIMHTAHRHTNHSHTNTNTNTNTWEQVMFGRAARGAGDCQPDSKRIK